jgi:hypothetical protein
MTVESLPPMVLVGLEVRKQSRNPVTLLELRTLIAKQAPHLPWL